jgi:hypothetical protein
MIEEINIKIAVYGWKKITFTHPLLILEQNSNNLPLYNYIISIIKE